MRKRRISRTKQAKLVEHFVAGTTARCAAGLAGVNKTTAAYYYHRLRELIYRAAAAPFAGEVEVDESYFGGRRKGKRGRGAAGKVPVFGLLKRGGKVYAVVIADAKATTLLPILKRRSVPDSIVYRDALPSDNALAVAGFRHLRINPSKLFAAGKNHINGIENFWNQAKRHLRKFNGVPKEHFPLFLKEWAWRFNNPNPKTQLQHLNQWVHQFLTQLSRTAPNLFSVLFSWFSFLAGCFRRNLKGAHLMLPSEATDQGGLAEKTQGGAHSGARLGFVSAYRT